MTEPLLRWLDGTTGAGLSSVLVHLTWQGALVGLAAFLALRLVGRASVARCRIAMAALGLLALVPAATLARRGGWLARTSLGLVALVPEGTRRAPEASAPHIDAPGAERQIGNAGNPAGPGDRLARSWRAARPWLLIGWLMGVLLSFARLAGGIARLHRLRRRSTPAPPLVTRDVELLARRLGITNGTGVRVSGDVCIPLTFGALRPVVLLPRRLADDLRPDQLRLVVAHELAHVARRDYPVNLAQCVVEVLLFFHPVVHWLSRTLREEREYCCDELAASVAGDRREVASALVALEELVAVRSARTLAPAATGGILLRRIERLLTTARPPRRFHTMRSLGVLVIAVALVVLATPASARIGAVEHLADGFSVVWAGGVGPGERLRVRNLVGSIRVVPVAGDRATIRARLSGGVLSDLVFEPTRGAEGPTVCALRGVYGRCDAEGYTWFGTQAEMHRAVIDLMVELPVGASITAASFDGDLVLDGVGGDVEARTGRGTITARVATARADRTLELHTGAGEVRVALPPGFGGTLQARLSDGAVEHEMPLMPIGEFSPQRMRASLGSGGNRLYASSGRGSLVLTRNP
ncbi:MAG TPA: M56 family metallopeptidase [Gemmatimonadales bacterium]|nr:M56 family metallopeptidase [Gemmatimonadales bacterium]